MRPHQFPLEFELLNDDQLGLVHEWLDDHDAYRVIIEKLEAQFGVKISKNKLSRYNQCRALGVEIAEPGTPPVPARDLYRLMNGEELPYNEVTLRQIEKKLCHLALKFDQEPPTVTRLAQVQRLMSYRFKRDLARDRHDLAQKQEQFRTRRLAPSASATPPAPRARPACSNPASNLSPTPSASSPAVPAATLSASPSTAPIPFPAPPATAPGPATVPASSTPVPAPAQPPLSSSEWSSLLETTPAPSPSSPFFPSPLASLQFSRPLDRYTTPARPANPPDPAALDQLAELIDRRGLAPAPFSFVPPHRRGGAPYPKLDPANQGPLANGMNDSKSQR